MAQAGETQAQVLYGSLLGNVRDQTGAAIPGADVEVHNIETGLTRNAITNEVGNYNFPTLRAGTYTVRVTMPGFREYVQENIALRVNSVVRVDATLVLGELTESLTVTAVPTLLQTDRAEVRSEIPVEKLGNLPVPLGRNFQHFISTLPGVTIARNAHSVPTNPSRALQFEVQGVSGSSNDFRIDGASNYDVWLPHITAYVPALESIETVNVVTSSFDAEQGLAGGSAINVQVKSGTNDLRGSAFWYNSNNKLMETPFFMPAGERNPKFIENQFGGTLGGPIVRDRIFFFGSYEATPKRQFASALRTIPSMAMRAGDMSLSDRDIYDPFTGNPDGSGREPFPRRLAPVQRGRIRFHGHDRRLHALLSARPPATDRGQRQLDPQSPQHPVRRRSLCAADEPYAAGVLRRRGEGIDLQARLELFNLTNTPHFSNPGGNRSAMTLNADGTIRSLGGYTQVTGIANLGREGIDQRTLRIGLRLGF
jgi:hypothetical protein